MSLRWRSRRIRSSLFFFQAEDGIRDYKVTGVQTCALPISSTGDFANIRYAALNGCFWTSGSCNWPAPADNLNANLDDLWHAAVNGRGTYYQALNPDALRQGISAALTSLNAVVAAAAASATSSPNVTQSDNQIFSTTYETNTWSGKVIAQTVDPTTGNVNPTITC